MGQDALHVGLHVVLGLVADVDNLLGRLGVVSVLSSHTIEVYDMD